uniref:Uncharacterized protein n=1 Tax=Neolamprologus brichardi TaxID=32507 RepID=A0A3Q4ICS1_NEOBR
MPGVLGVIARRAAPVLRGHVVAQRASIYTRPAKEKIGSFVSLIYRRTTFDMSINCTLVSIIEIAVLKHLTAYYICQKNNFLSVCAAVK